MTLSLFADKELKVIHNQDGTILYQDNYTQSSIEHITEGLTWRNDPITLYGKTYPQPRLTAWHGNRGLTYCYSHIKMTSPGWTPALKKLRDQLEADLKIPFNSVLVNLYRDGSDHMSYHADDEKELGPNPTIASLSLGATRKFMIKHRFDKSQATRSFDLKDGSLLVMKGELQEFWFHKIAKTTRVSQPRLNLTFRYILES